jgi:hypothetical protein
MQSGERLECETQPGCAVVNTVRGVERCGKEFTETIEAGDTSPGQLRVRDKVISERITNIEGFDSDAVAETVEKFVRGRGLFGNSSVGKFEERLRGRGVRHVRRWGREGRGGERGLVGHYGQGERAW